MGFEYVPPVDGIWVIKMPNWMQYRFEWHSKKQRVYMIDLGQKVKPGGMAIAETVALEVPDHGSAVNAVLIWCRGYQTGQRNKQDEQIHLIGAE